MEIRRREGAAPRTMAQIRRAGKPGLAGTGRLPARHFRASMPVMKRLTLLAAALCATAQPSAAADAPPPVGIARAEQAIAAGVQLVDVRTRAEWDAGHLRDAKFLPLAGDDFPARAKAALDPTKPVLVYCKAGGRSARAAEQLRKAGFTVHDLEGGITAWQQAGKPVVK